MRARVGEREDCGHRGGGARGRGAREPPNVVLLGCQGVRRIEAVTGEVALAHGKKCRAQFQVLFGAVVVERSR